MKKNTTVINDTHKYVLSQLKTIEFATFSDIRPEKVNSNTFSYHVKKMITDGWIVKTDIGYTLGTRGLAYVERDTSDRGVRMLPNIVIAMVVQNGDGMVLVKKRLVQPHINHWELPSVPATVADLSVVEAGKWGAKKLLHIVPEDVRHVGDCYVRSHKHKLAVGSTLFHVVRFEVEDETFTSEFQWVDPLDLGKLNSLPGTEAIVTRAFFNDTFFFEEFGVQHATQESLSLPSH